jgi:hypothetical protein
VRGLAAWGQGERGAAGYDDAGTSELLWRNGALLGGLTSDESGRPALDTPPPDEQGTKGQ